MIQRIQSVHLFIVAVLLALVFFFPLASVLGEDGNEIILRVINYPILIAFVAGAFALSFSSIFLFKKRTLQIRLNIYSLLLILTSIGFMSYYLWASGNKYTAVVPKLAFVLPIVSLMFVVFAIMSIRKDEKIIQSLKRLR